MLPNRSGKSGQYFIVLNWALENALSLLVRGPLWVFVTPSIAYAAERGFTAWVQRCNSLEDVKQYLLQGLPVIASIRTAAKEDLPGAIMAYTSGHLLVVTGLLVQDGKPYVLVNDPAAHRDEDVQRQYPLERFLKAWTRKMIYVLQK